MPSSISNALLILTLVLSSRSSSLTLGFTMPTTVIHSNNNIVHHDNNNQRLQNSAQIPPLVLFMTSSTNSETEIESPNNAKEKKTRTKKLSILTFDLDDTLYPISTVIDDANSAFSRCMDQFGFPDIKASQIVDTGRRIRAEMAETDPEQSACLTHTETRRLAIREEMEKIQYQRKLQACADDWATTVSSLSPLVVQNAKKWASTAISPSVVEAVLNAWEMERHHAAERHLYPDVMDMFEQIKADHPNVIIGAVTDGKANPLFMTFTLAKHFDFCINWEDDQAGRKQFFTDLSNVEKDADLRWIYSATKEKGEELAKTAALLRGEEYPDSSTEYVWIHVGDDLALDVGGAATCGAKTIFAELADKKYHQTARHRFDNIDDLEKKFAWSNTPKKELERRQIMNAEAEKLVDKKVAFLSHIPEAINQILEMED